jgi:hypothetical protein
MPDSLSAALSDWCVPHKLSSLFYERVAETVALPTQYEFYANDHQYSSETAHFCQSGRLEDAGCSCSTSDPPWHHPEALPLRSRLLAQLVR